MKNVLLLVHDDEGQEARLRAALDMTRELNGHLTCVDIAVPQVPVGDPYYGGAQAMLVDFACEREAVNKTRVQARLAREDVPWTWIDTIGTLADGLLAEASLADIIVLNRQLNSGWHPNMRDIASRVVMHARKPVLAVPQTLNRLDLRRALIAWDGQTSAAVTMRSCIPLLELAEDVEIFMVRDGSEQIEPTEAAQYLARRDIHANVTIIEDDRTPPDKLIADECARWNADYVVMGAYGHGRLIEMFGGVTKRMLTSSKLPLVMGH
jgi:nucleotide-binding universal stress UspA family protein